MFARIKRCAAAFVLGCGAIFWTACGGPAASAGNTAASTTALPASMSGKVTVDGSSTVLPVSRAMTAAFKKSHPNVQVSLESSGTGGGFKMLCAGQADLIGASRPINAAEARECAARGIEFIELPVAFDSLSVVVNPKNAFVSCLTVSELKDLWEPAAAGKITKWNQVRSTFPAEPVTLYGPGAASGTFDYFTHAIVGTEGSSRTDYTSSEDDEHLVNGVAETAGALAYFGFAYYLENKDRLKLVAIDDGHGCVEPSAQTVTDATYQPLSRPIFVYIGATAAARPEARALAAAFVSPDHARDVERIGYVPLPAATLLLAGRRLDTLVVGSRFGGRGSVVGLTADVFVDDDRVKSALVR